MKAIRFHSHGGPEVLAVRGRARCPRRVRVRRWCASGATSLNHLDIWQRRGIERVRIPFPHISGADVAGEVVEAPGGTLAAGRRVMLQPGLSCGRCAVCLDGRDNECPRYDVLGYQSDGGYAECVRVPVENVDPDSRRHRFVEAAAFPLTFLTAWHMLLTRARLQAGRDGAGARRRQRRRPGRDPDRAAARRAGDCHGRHRREAGQGAGARRVRSGEPHHATTSRRRCAG